MLSLATEAAAQEVEFIPFCRGGANSADFEVGVVMDVPETYTVVMIDMVTGDSLADSRRDISSTSLLMRNGCQYWAHKDSVGFGAPGRVQYLPDRLYRIDMFPADPASNSTPGSYYYSFPESCTAGSGIFCPVGMSGGQPDLVFFIGTDGPRAYLSAFGAFGVGQSVEAVFGLVAGGESWVLPYDASRFCALAPSRCGASTVTPSGVPSNDIIFLSRIPFRSGPQTLPVPLHAALHADWRVPSGVTYNWSSADVSQIVYGTGGHITVNGTLNSTGLSLTADNVSQGWGGIQYSAGSGGTITGGEITKVKTYGGAAVSISGASPTLSGVTISDSPCCGTDAVSVGGSASNPTIQNATIRQMSGTGVYLSDHAQARLIHNIIRNNGEDGVIAGYGTSAFLSPDAPNGFRIGNDILNNDGNGVYATLSAYLTYGWYFYKYGTIPHVDGYNNVLGNGLAGNRVVLGGAIAGGNSSAQRRNGFYDNVGNEVQTEGSGSRAYVSCDYWGPGATPPFQTAATGGGTITLYSYVTQDPRMYPLTPCVGVKEGGVRGRSAGGSVDDEGRSQSDRSAVDGPSSDARGEGDGLADLLDRAAEIGAEHPAAALALLRQVVADGDDALASAALAEAGRIASGPRALPAVRELLSSHAAGPAGPRRRAALRALVAVREQAGDAAGALDAARVLAVSDDRGAAAFGHVAQVFLFADAGRMDEATAALAALEEDLPGSREVAMARRRLGLAPAAAGRGDGEEEGKTDARGDAQSDVAAFALLPARPNPARTATAVPFSLGGTARVRLAVYDVLGREVAVLADGPFEAGSHEGVLDASHLVAGVYLVRLTARTDDGRALSFTNRLTVIR